MDEQRHAAPYSEKGEGAGRCPAQEIEHWCLLRDDPEREYDKHKRRHSELTKVQWGCAVVWLFGVQHDILVDDSVIALVIVLARLVLII